MLEAIIARNPTEKLYVEDVFSTYLHTGNGVSQDIFNGVNLGDNITGSVANFGTNTAFSFPHSDNLILSSGEDFTYEVWIKTPRTANGMLFNKGGEGAVVNNIACVVGSNGLIYLDINGNRAFTTDVDVVPANKWTHIAITRVFATVRCFVNGVLILTASASGKAESTLPFLIGAKDTSGFTPQFTGQMSNFRFVKGAALYTSAFTPSRTNLTAVSGTQLLTFTTTSLFTDSSSNNFTPTNTGVTSVTAITPLQQAGIGKGGLVWIKTRSAVTNHRLYDTTRGVEKDLNTNSTGTEGTDTGSLTAFSSSGFALGSGTNTNTNGATYASWTFRKAKKFFDIVTWSGNDGTQTIPHSLGATPGMIIAKRTSTTGSWRVYHKSASTQYGNLNGAEAFTSTSAQNVWGNNSTVVAPTSTGFTVGNDSSLNSSGHTYIAYVFADSNSGGFGDTGSNSITACGTYSGLDTGQEINLGWEPQFILIKIINSTGNWIMVDNMRGANYDKTNYLRSNDNTVEGVNSSASYGVIPTATGFRLQGSGGGDTNFGTSGYNYIYFAIRRGPMKTPTDATKVFKPVAYTGDGTATKKLTTDFPVDLGLIRQRAASNQMNVVDRLRGIGTASPVLYTSETFDEGAYNYAIADNTSYQLGNGTTRNNNDSGVTYIGEFFRRAPGFFDVVCYSGNSSAALGTQSVTHNLGVAPELIIIKARNKNGGVWFAGTNFRPTAQSIGYFNTSGSLQASYPYSAWFGAPPTTTIFTPINQVASPNVQNANESGITYVAYLFASCTGVSKVGSYTGNGSSQNIDCGFTNGARFILIKRTDTTGDWYVWDTARGIIAANDPHLSLNSTAAEVTTDDSIDPLSTGFTVNQVTATNINVNAATYIYLAIA